MKPEVPLTPASAVLISTAPLLLSAAVPQVRMILHRSCSSWPPRKESVMFPPAALSEALKSNATLSSLN